MSATRRTVLAGLASTMPAIALAAPSSPDAALIGYCKEANDIARRADAIMGGTEELTFSDPVSVRAFKTVGPMMRRYHRAVASAASEPATTKAGLLAKADLVKRYLGDNANDSDIALSLADDVLRLGGLA